VFSLQPYSRVIGKKINYFDKDAEMLEDIQVSCLYCEYWCRKGLKGIAVYSGT